MNILNFLLNIFKKIQLGVTFKIDTFKYVSPKVDLPSGPGPITMTSSPITVVTPVIVKNNFAQEQEAKLAQLYPPFAIIIRQFVQAANEMGMPVAVFEGLRTFERQQELYSKGRDKNGKVIDKSKVVTNAIPGMSYHQYGIAADIVFNADPSNPKFQWSWDDKFSWQRLAIVGKDRFNLEAGYFWKAFPDTPHYQISYGLQISELMTLYKQGGLDNVWNVIGGKPIKV